MACPLRSMATGDLMPRATRYSPPNSVHHVINRGNDRRCLFETASDFSEFLALMGWAKERCPVRLVAYCLMPNHWHMILWPEESESIAKFMHRLCTSHAIRRRKATGTIGQGHVYQHRYHAFVIETEPYYFRAVKYVEANPLRAGLVTSAANWPWSSLAERLGADRGILNPGPLTLPGNWQAQVDAAMPQAEMDDIHNKLRRHSPVAPRRPRQIAETAMKST